MEEGKAPCRISFHAVSGCIAFLIALAILTSRSSQTIYWGDDGSLITHSCNLSLGHPPGHPVYMMGQRPGFYFPLGDIASRYSIMSSLWLAGSSGVLCMVLLSLFRNRHQAMAAGAALLGLLMLQPGIVRQGLRAETYALQLFMTTLVLWMMMKLEKMRLGVCAGFLMGLMSANHIFLAGLILPAVLLGAVTECAGRSRIRCLLLFCLGYAWGLSPYLYVLIRGNLPLQDQWISVGGFSDFWDYITAREYRDQFEITTLGGIFRHIRFNACVLAEEIRNQTGLAELLAGVAGFFWMIFAFRRFAMVLILMIIGIVAGVCSISTYDPSNWDFQGYLAGATAVICLFQIAGISSIAGLIRSRKIVVFVIAAGFSLCAFHGRVTMIPAVRDTAARQIGKIFLLHLPERTVLLTRSDMNYILLYLNRVEKMREDIDIKSRNDIIRKDRASGGNSKDIRRWLDEWSGSTSLAWEMADDDPLIAPLQKSLMDAVLMIGEGSYRPGTGELLTRYFRLTGYGQNLAGDRNALEQLEVLFYNRGRFLLTQGDAGGAVRDLMFSVLMNSKPSKFRNNLGVALALTGRYQEAKQQFLHIISKDPHYQGSYDNLQRLREMHPNGQLD